MSEVKLIALTQPVTGHVGLTPASLVAYCARVSNPANQDNFDTADKLLNYLAKNQHWSPFEMVSLTIEVVTTRDIARQILRHRSFSFQEFSQRYSEVVAPHVVRETRFQHATNRQSSLEATPEDANVAAQWEHLHKEVARAVLPDGTTQSRFYMAGTLRSWLHYVLLRSGNGTQKEHREIAEKCKGVLLDNFPSLSEMLSGKS